MVHYSALCLVSQIFDPYFIHFYTLQSLPTKDGAQFLCGPEEVEHLTNEQFVQKYTESERGQDVLQKLATPIDEEIKKCLSHDCFKKRYSNSTLRSIKVVFAREVSYGLLDIPF